MKIKVFWAMTQLKSLKESQLSKEKETTLSAILRYVAVEDTRPGDGKINKTADYSESLLGISTLKFPTAVLRIISIHQSYVFRQLIIVIIKTT